MIIVDTAFKIGRIVIVAARKIPIPRVCRLKMAERMTMTIGAERMRKGLTA